MGQIPNKEKHQRIAGYIFIVMGTLLSVVSIVAFNMYFLGSAIFGHELPRDVSLGIFTLHNPFQLLIFIPIFYACLSAFDLAVGFGILRQKIWAQKLALIAAFFMFFNFPLGSFLCFYIFYAFINDDLIHSFSINGKPTKMGH